MTWWFLWSTNPVSQKPVFPKKSQNVVPSRFKSTLKSFSSNQTRPLKVDCCSIPGNPYRRGRRISTVYLLVLTYQLVQISYFSNWNYIFSYLKNYLSQCGGQLYQAFPFSKDSLLDSIFKNLRISPPLRLFLSISSSFSPFYSLSSLFNIPFLLLLSFSFSPTYFYFC